MNLFIRVTIKVDIVSIGMFVNTMNPMWNNMCTKDNDLLIPTASAQSQSHTVCRLLDPWQIKIYHISDYSSNVFLFILHNILYTGNKFEPISITIIFY